VATILVAVVFDFTNGFHDTANAIATSVSTRAMGRGRRSSARPSSTWWERWSRSKCSGARSRSTAMASRAAGLVELTGLRSQHRRRHHAVKQFYTERFVN
jgi:hypothetical protein